MSSILTVDEQIHCERRKGKKTREMSIDCMHEISEIEYSFSAVSVIWDNNFSLVPETHTRFRGSDSVLYLLGMIEYDKQL